MVLTLVLIFYHRYRKKKLLGAKLITTHSPEAGVWSSWAALSSSYDDHDQPEIRVKDQGKSVHIGDKLIATTKRWVHIIGFGSFGLLMFASGILLLFNNHIPQGIIVIVVGVIPLIIALYYTIPIIYVCFSCNHIFGIPKLTGKIKLAINPINMMGKSLATVKYICPYCRSHDINIITIKSKLLPKLTQ